MSLRAIKKSSYYPYSFIRRVQVNQNHRPFTAIAASLSTACNHSAPLCFAEFKRLRISSSGFLQPQDLISTTSCPRKPSSTSTSSSADTANMNIITNQAAPTYHFPRHRLKLTQDDPTKTPVVLVACGSFSPVCTSRPVHLWKIYYAYAVQMANSGTFIDHLPPLTNVRDGGGLCKIQCQAWGKVGGNGRLLFTSV